MGEDGFLFRGEEEKVRNKRILRLVYAAVCLTLAMLLPLITGQIRAVGNALCPMHIPVLLCGYLCGPVWGAAVGIIAPLLRSALWGMPVLFPNAVGMAVELACYGAIAGALYRRFPHRIAGVYGSLLTAMVGGRVAWGLARFAIARLTGMSFPLSAFWVGAVGGAVPGILLQILLVPPIVLALRRSGTLLID